MCRVVAQYQNLSQNDIGRACLVVKEKVEKNRDMSLIPIMSNNDAVMFKMPCKTAWGTGPSAVWRTIVKCATEAGYDLSYVISRSATSLFTHKFIHSTQKQWQS